MGTEHDIPTGCMSITAVKGFRDALPEAARLLSRVERGPRSSSAMLAEPGCRSSSAPSCSRARRRDHRHRREEMYTFADRTARC
jgi:hypothetical protein